MNENRPHIVDASSGKPAKIEEAPLEKKASPQEKSQADRTSFWTGKSRLTSEARRQAAVLAILAGKNNQPKLTAEDRRRRSFDNVGSNKAKPLDKGRRRGQMPRS